MTTVGTIAYTRAHTVTFVTDRILYALKEIVRLVGLLPTKLSRHWNSLDNGVATWTRSGHLRQVILEITNQSGTRLVSRWDFDLDYDLAGDGSMWADIEEIRYDIAKHGLVPSDCDYRFIVDLAPGYPWIDGWDSSQLLPTTGFRRYSLGTTIDGNGIGARTSYWRQS